MKREEAFPQQQQEPPGAEKEMAPRPIPIAGEYKGSGKLEGKICIVTGADSGIGRAVALHYAREGAAGLGLIYRQSHEDAAETKRMLEEESSRCQVVAIASDLGDESSAHEAVHHCVSELCKGDSPRVDVLVNNAGEQHEDAADVVEGRLDVGLLQRTFASNIFSVFYATNAALPLMRPGSAIINCSSINAFKGHPTLLAYAATKGAIVAYTRSLALALVSRGIRVNSVAPGPIWTPLIVSSFQADKIPGFGKSCPMHRAGQPAEVAPSFVFLASNADSSYFTGKTLHPNGGYVVNA